MELSLGRVLAERAHDSAQLLRGDGTVTILVEQGEDLLDLGNLLLCADKPSFSIRTSKYTPPPVALPPLISDPACIGASPRPRHPHGAEAGWAGDALRHGRSTPVAPDEQGAAPPPLPAHTSQLVREFLELRDLLGVRRGICFHLLGHFEHSFRVLFDLDKMTMDANTIPVIMSGVMRVNVKCMCVRRVAAYRMRICLTCCPLSQVALA